MTLAPETVGGSFTERHSYPEAALGYGKRIVQTVRAAGDKTLLMWPSNGTGAAYNDWSQAVTYRFDPDEVSIADEVFVSGQTGNLIVIAAGVPVRCGFKLDYESPESIFPFHDVKPESAEVAREVRDLSGISAASLGDLFPVSRETFQRWISGGIIPSQGNLERLLALRHYFREVRNRVQTPKTWLLAPLETVSSGVSPFDLLAVGDLAAAWEALSSLPAHPRTHRRVAADGTVLTVVEGSLRGRDLPTPADEMGDYDEWLSKDE